MAKKVLIIEDDKDIRDTVTLALEDEGYEVISSENAKILKSVHQHQPDIILLDNWLTDWSSDANGQQLSKELKSNPATSDIPVIIVSGVSNIQEIAKAGMANGYLKKPFGIEELTAIIKKHIK